MLSSTVRFARRIAITAAGFVLIVLGGVLLVAPGPGFLVIALGLLVLGVEYEWARRRFEQVRDKVGPDVGCEDMLATGGQLDVGAQQRMRAGRLPIRRERRRPVADVLPWRRR